MTLTACSVNTNKEQPEARTAEVKLSCPLGLKEEDLGMQAGEPNNVDYNDEVMDDDAGNDYVEKLIHTHTHNYLISTWEIMDITRYLIMECYIIIPLLINEVIM